MVKATGSCERLKQTNKISDGEKKDAIVGVSGNVLSANWDDEDVWRGRWKRYERKLEIAKEELRRQELSNAWKLDSEEIQDLKNIWGNEENSTNGLGEKNVENDAYKILERER